MKGGFSDQALSLSCCLKRHRLPGSNTSVVRAPGDDGGSFPLHGEERNRSKKPKYHHDQELPVEEKVVTVEKRHGRTNGLGTKKTNHDMHTGGPGSPVSPAARCDWLCPRLFLHPDGTHVSLAHTHTCTTNAYHKIPSRASDNQVSHNLLFKIAYCGRLGIKQCACTVRTVCTTNELNSGT